MKKILITLTALMCSLSTAAFAGATNDLIYVRVGDAALNLRLSDTEAAKELKAMVDEKDVTVEMSDNVFEQYGSLGKNLTSDDVSIAAKAGDVLLYNSRYICIFYGQNTYRYTRLGRILSFSAWSSLSASITTISAAILRPATAPRTTP